MAHFSSHRVEKDVGITRLLGTDARFSAVVKQRFSDFHVNEIDCSGRIVHLTSLEPPVDNSLSVALNDPGVASLIPEASRTNIAELERRLKEQKSFDKFTDSVKIKVTELEKESRTQIHKWVSNFEKLSSETVDEEGEKYILVIPLKGNPRLNRRPANRAKFTHCVLYKEGVETSDAIGMIAKKLNLKPGLISYAGTKDKRAKTTQRISVSNMDAGRLIGITKHMRGLKLGNFEYHPRPIALGELGGNHFKLLLKEVKGRSDEEICGAVETFKTLGFINYYGLQRFGSYEISTHEIGKKVLQKNWLEAFDLILKPKSNDPEFMVKAKKAWLEERNAEEAVQFIHRHHRSIESHLLHGLARFYLKNDCIAAFQRIPRNVRLLYVHAYQSYLWNRLASYRIEELGMVPVEGDLVYAIPGQTEAFSPDLLSMNQEGESLLDEPIIRVTDPPIHLKVDVKQLSKEEIADGKYTIYDVLIPLHGTEIKHPSNVVRDQLLKLLKEDGIQHDCFLNYRPITDAPKGAYRRLLTLPRNVSHKSLQYSESDSVDSFIVSDWDILQTTLSSRKGEKVVAVDAAEEEVTQKSDAAEEAIPDKKDKRCLILEFSLPPSSYATMALRELMLEETHTQSVATPSSRDRNAGATQPKILNSKIYFKDEEEDEEEPLDKKPKLE